MKQQETDTMEGKKMKKFSKQRELILNSLKSRKDHPTAETLFWDLKKKKQKR